MIKKLTLRAVCAGVLCAMLLPSAMAQTPPPGASGPLTDAGRAEAVAKAAEALRTRYIFPEAGETAAKKIEAQLAAGAYKDLEARAFAEKVTADLQSVTKDKHMRVSVQGAPPPGAAAAGPPPASEGGFVRADRLAGDIGYVEVNGFPPPAGFKAAADKAMAALKDTKALIIDVRRNGGGSPESVGYLVSFFLDPAKPPLLINDFTSRVPGRQEFTTRQSFSVKTPTSYVGKKIYVLTAARTFSGGEEFAYDMQSFKLGVTVGELTGGGANPGGVGPIGSGMGLFVPNGRPTNPVTKTNWEGAGVIPDIKTAPEDALKVALEKLGQKPAAKDIDALSQARLFAPRSTPLPGTEAALRTMIEGIVKGAPDYSKMGPGLANATRDQLEAMQGRLAVLGAMKSMTFFAPGPQGGDVYDIVFENGGVRWSIVLDAEGKATGSLYSSMPPANMPPKN
jgi:hypothetical protein